MLSERNLTVPLDTVDASSSGVLALTLFSLAHSMISSLLESVALSLLACVPAAVFSLSSCTLMCRGSQRPAARRPGPAAGEELLQVPKDAANGGEVANDGCCAGSACQHRFVMATRYLGVENRNKAATRQRGRSCSSFLSPFKWLSSNGTLPPSAARSRSSRSCTRPPSPCACRGSP